MRTFESTTATYLMRAVMCFGLWWILISFSNLNNFVALYSSVTYYDNVDDNTKAEVGSGVYHACITHLGSILFGSLFLWFPKIFRPIFNSLPQSMQNCMFNTKFDPPNVGLAYMAVSGDSLCVSANNGF